MKQTYLNNARENYLNGFGAGMGHHPYNLNGYPPVPAGSGFGAYEQAAAGMHGSPDGLGYYIKNAIGVDDDVKAAADAPMPADMVDKNVRIAIGIGLGSIAIYMAWRVFKGTKPLLKK